MRTLKTVGLALVASLFLLAGCGGGDEPTQQPQAPVASVTVTTSAELALATKVVESRERALAGAKAAQPKTTGIKISTKKRALGFGDPGSGGESTITADELFNWAEATYPQLFPAGATSYPFSENGVDYTVRYYQSTGNYLGVTTSGQIYGDGPFTNFVMTPFGNLTDFTCKVKPTLAQCVNGGNNAVKAGTLMLSKEAQLFVPDYVNGELDFFGDASGGHKIAPDSITGTRWNSNRKGWGASSQATLMANGALYMAGMCNNDRGLPTILVGDQEYWAGFGMEGGWQLGGDLNPRLVNGMIEYGKNGYQRSTVSAVREGNMVTLRLNFGSDCLGGFGKDGVLIPLDWRQPLQFAFHSNNSGAGGKAGWGLGTAAPTTKLAYATIPEGSEGFVVEFKGLSCTDKGVVTVYRAKTVNGDQIDYEFGDGFGAGYLVVPGEGDPDPIWTAESGVTFDSKDFTIDVSVFCL